MNQIEYAVEMEKISKIYKLKKKDVNSPGAERFYALKDISLKIQKGDVVGILGTNGSGKSTLAQVLAGISEIDEGNITINGEQALISINTGLNNQLTGFENINVKGALLGFNKKKVQEITEGVIEFAELGDFLYQPVKTYSSGMKSRLGFSISLALDPDILIVDEALSVGDKGFAKKCLNRMKQLRDEKEKTILFISHSLPQVKGFCRTGLWIDGGRLREMGDIDTVCDHYSEYVEELNELPKKEKKKLLEDKLKERIIVEKKRSFWSRIWGER
ncbi:MAG TPA: ATP-binding cassette domain-containing protein [Candidatus Mediterraneibacter pullistercoris]|nr:ATP-binding cassette domain-containing protein [Candidatus Mediterraneibacter pullistercoris]